MSLAKILQGTLDNGPELNRTLTAFGCVILCALQLIAMAALGTPFSVTEFALAYATILTGGSVGVSLKDRAVAVVAAAKASIKRGDDESA